MKTAERAGGNKVLNFRSVIAKAWREERGNGHDGWDLCPTLQLTTVQFADGRGGGTKSQYLVWGSKIRWSIMGNQGGIARHAC